MSTQKGINSYLENLKKKKRKKHFTGHIYTPKDTHQVSRCNQRAKDQCLAHFENKIRSAMSSQLHF